MPKMKSSGRFSTFSTCNVSEVTVGFAGTALQPVSMRQPASRKANVLLFIITPVWACGIVAACPAHHSLFREFVIYIDPDANGLYGHTAGLRGDDCAAGGFAVSHQIPAAGEDGSFPFEVGMAQIPQHNENNKKSCQSRQIQYKMPLRYDA